MNKKYLFLKKHFSIFMILGLVSGCDIFSPPKTPCPQKATSRPYSIDGRTHVPQKHYELNQVGYASYYGGKDGMHGCITCTGERFNMFALTAAHKTLPVPSMIEVTNLENGRKIILRVNDRGPFARNRILDVSAAAARQLGFYHKGYAKVRIHTLVQKSKKIEKRLQRVKRLAPPKKASAIECWYYIDLKVSSLFEAKKVAARLKEHGHIHIIPAWRNAHVMMGPYRSRESIHEMQRFIPELNKGKIVQRCKTYPATHKKK